MAGLPRGKPEEMGIDAGRLQTAHDLLRGWTAGPDAPVPGGAILLGRAGKVSGPEFFGRQGPEADAPPIRQDGLFLLASIAKPVTYTAAMLLVERGLLNLSDRVTRYVPGFAAHHKEDTRVLHLFTHTSGLPDMLPNNAQLRRRHAPLEEFITGAIHDTVPLFPPGTDLKYQSMGTLVVADIVRRITGRPIAEFLKAEIFDPLGMNSTGLGSAGLDEQRIVRVEEPEYQRGGDFGWNSTYWRQLGAPWGGLFSTPADLAVFCQMILDQGQYGGRRLLSPITVERMTTNRLDELPWLPEVVRRANRWGLGWRLNPWGTGDSWGDLLGPRVFGHVGATGTMLWIDPERQAFLIILTSAIRDKNRWRFAQLSNALSAAIV